VVSRASPHSCRLLGKTSFLDQKHRVNDFDCKLTPAAGRLRVFRYKGDNQVGARPSRSNWSDHSAGASRKAATPMPRGSRPSMAAFTSAGAINAIDIVMLTWRMLHFWRAAIRSTVVLPATISSSQARPRAIDLSSAARRSNFIGRTWCRSVAVGSRISLNLSFPKTPSGLDSRRKAESSHLSE